MKDAELPPELILRQLLHDHPDDVTDIALAARHVVLKLAGACCEMIYETYCISDAFSFTGKLGQSFIHIATYSQHVNLGFSRGTQLDDPCGLLCGTGKLIRHIRLNSTAETRGRDVKRLVLAAVAQGRQMAEAGTGIIAPHVTVHRKNKK